MKLQRRSPAGANPGMHRQGPPAVTALLIALVLGWPQVSSAQLGGPAEWPLTDFSRMAVDKAEIFSGGPPKDGIPSIDEPQFDDLATARDWIDDREPVIVLNHGDQTKLYPLQILMWHEIVNDEIAGLPVSVTFCPLCNATVVFDRRVDGKVLDFGTTGRLRKSDLIMYDRQTESWWQQFTGRGIIGHYMDVDLVKVPAAIVAFEDAGAAYPDAMVLSRRTGHRRDYGRNPYRGYDSVEDQPFLFFDPVDKRLPPMERLLNISAGDAHHVYPFSELEKAGVVNDIVAGRPVAVFSKEGTFSVLDESAIDESKLIASATAFDRRVENETLEFEFSNGRIKDKNTGSEWSILGKAIAGPLVGKQLAPLNAGIHFAFAWLAFNPESVIYRPGS